MHANVYDSIQGKRFPSKLVLCGWAIRPTVIRLKFNSCTKPVGSLVIMHDRTPDCHPISWAVIPDFTTDCNFDSQATWVIDVLG